MAIVGEEQGEIFVSFESAELEQKFAPRFTPAGCTIHEHGISGFDNLRKAQRTARQINAAVYDYHGAAVANQRYAALTRK